MRRVPLTWTGLLLAFASALVIDTAYSLEHDAVAALRLAPLTVSVGLTGRYGRRQ